MEDHVNEEHSEEKKVCTCGEECNCGDNCECGEGCDCEKCGVVEKGEAEISETEDVVESESATVAETETVAPAVAATYTAPEASRRPLEKVMIVCSKAGVDSVYAALIMANGARSEGIEVDMFFTFFGLDTITKKRMEHLKVAIAGNPGMHMPEMVGVLPGMEAFATNMMRKEMEKLDIPGVGEFLEIIKAAGGMIFGCKLAAEMFHLTRDDMWEGVDDILTVGQFYERATERSQIIFI